MDYESREEFVMLTQNALNEPDSEKFIEYLLKRDQYVKQLVKCEPGMFGNMLDEYRLRESLILKRLEDERRKTLEKIAVLSEKKKAVRSYTSRFPFPPVFSPHKTSKKA